MYAVKLKITHKDFHNHRSRRIQQGEIWVGSEPQSTILKSCVCAGFFNSQKKIGAISHITGFHSNDGHSPSGALLKIRNGLRQYGLDLSDCTCFIIGGTDRTKHVLENVKTELTAQGIRYNELDVLGACHRKLLFEPSTGILTLYKKSLDEPASPEIKTLNSTDCFRDSRKRLLTGASLFFRNQNLLKYVSNCVVPEVLNTTGRFHVWCAGCSIGMEPYSVAMIILDRLSRLNKINTDFKILATDISPESIEMGIKGEYPVNQNRMKDYLPIFEKYVERIDTHIYRMSPQLKRYITFRQHDIQQGISNHQFELVICDHVLQYFSAEMQLILLNKLVDSVQPGGFAYISSPSHIISDTMSQKYGFSKKHQHCYQKP